MIYPLLFQYQAIWCLRPWVRILHSAEVENLSPVNLKITCLCQNIEIQNNKHVYRQSQVHKSTRSAVEWDDECSLIMGTGCRVQVFSLILDSSVGLPAGFQSPGDLVSETIGSKTTCPLSLSSDRASILTTNIYIYICQHYTSQDGVSGSHLKWTVYWNSLSRACPGHTHTILLYCQISVVRATAWVRWLYEQFPPTTTQIYLPSYDFMDVLALKLTDE